MLVIVCFTLLVSNARQKEIYLAQPSKNCLDEPCKVSPDDGSRLSEADFPNLAEALRQVKSGATLILLAAPEGSTESIHTLPTRDRGDGFREPVPITKAIHLVGEEVAEEKRMPQIVPHWGWEQEHLFEDITRIYFQNSADSSIKNLLFSDTTGKARSRVEQTKTQANDLSYIPKMVRVENSKLDIVNCRFHFVNGTDVVEKSLATSENDIRRHRIVAIEYNNSQGLIQGNLVGGGLAGGIWVHGNQSEIEVMNNQIHSSWFALMIESRKAEVEGNVLFTIDGRHWNHCYKYPQDPDCAGWIGNQYNPRGIPLWDYSVIGLSVYGQEELDVCRNTIMGYHINLDISGATSSLSVDNNLFIYFADVGSSGKVIVNDKIARPDSGGSWGSNLIKGAGICLDLIGNNNQFDWSVCNQNVFRGFAMRGGPYGHFICGFWPKAGTQVANQKVGASFANGWEVVSLLSREPGCAKLPLVCSSALSCNQNTNQCWVPGEPEEEAPQIRVIETPVPIPTNKPTTTPSPKSPQEVRTKPYLLPSRPERPVPVPTGGLTVPNTGRTSPR